METIKLDLGKYKSGDNLLRSIAACIPGTVRILKNTLGKDDGFVDEKNKRIYYVRTEKGYMPKAPKSLPSIIENDFLNRKVFFMGDANYEGLHLLDYNIYLIAAAKYDGEGEWYDWYRVLGDYCELEQFRDSIKTEDGKTFIYSIFPYFDKERYWIRYKKKNEAPDELFGKLDHLEKYIFQRTGIDLDGHNELLLVHQDEVAFEYLLASVKWFNDGQPTAYDNDKVFLKEWDELDNDFKLPYSKRAVSIIRNQSQMWDVDAKISVDDLYKAPTNGDQAFDYVSFPIGKYMHMHFLACFGPSYSGSLSFEIIHERSGYRAKYGLIAPDISCPGILQRCGTEGFALSQVLGKGYKVPSDAPDYVTIILYHNRRKVFRKDFQVKRCGS